MSTNQYTRDELNHLLGMGETDLDQAGRRLEDETVDDRLAGPLTHGQPVYDVDTRMETHTIRITSSMWALVKKNAQEAGMSVSAWTRLAIAQAIRPTPQDSAG